VPYVLLQCVYGGEALSLFVQAVLVHMSKSMPTLLNGKQVGVEPIVLQDKDLLTFDGRVMRIEYGKILCGKLFGLLHPCTLSTMPTTSCRLR
jgi:hypothetical protein